MADIKLRKLGEDSILKINVSVSSEFKLRLWVAMRLFELACFVLGCGIEVTHSEQQQNS